MPGQSKTTLHAPPVVPDDLETFSHTGVVPTTYAQINFSEGNSVVTGMVSIVAKQANASTSFLEPASQLGVTDVFVAITPPIDSRLHLQALVGAFTSRFGSPGEYDEGRYGTPLIARISGVGEQVTAEGRLRRSDADPDGRPARPEQQGVAVDHRRRLEQLRRSRRGQLVRRARARRRRLAPAR